MCRDLRNKDNKLATAYWAVAGALTAGVTSIVPTLAATVTFWDKLEQMLGEVYDKIFGLTTLVAVLMAVIALVIRMISRNQRAVEEATNWLKRIAICWLLINGLGFIVTTLGDLVAGGKWTP